MGHSYPFLLACLLRCAVMRQVRRRPASWRLAAAWAVLVVPAPGVVALLIGRQYVAAAGYAAGLVAAARWVRRWPWTASLLFWLEIRRTRNEDGEARFACPLAGPVQRRRPVPREPACPEVSHE